MKRKLTAILLSLAMLLVYAPIGVFAEAGDSVGQDDLLKVEAKEISDTSVMLTWTPANDYEPSQDVKFTVKNGEDDLTGELSAASEENEEVYEYADEEVYEYDDEEGYYYYTVNDLEAETEYELEVVSSDAVGEDEKAPSGRVQFTTKEAAEEVVEEVPEEVAEPEEEVAEPKLLSAGNGEESEPDTNNAPVMKLGAVQQKVMLEAGTVKTTTAELKWTLNGYDVEPQGFTVRQNDKSLSDDKFSVTGDLESGYSCKVSGLKSGTKYKFSVEVKDNASSRSEPITITTALPAMKSVRASITTGDYKKAKNYLKLRWAKVDGAAKYVIRWSGDGYEKKYTVKESLIFKRGVLPSGRGKTYAFRIQAFDANGKAITKVTASNKVVLPKVTVTASNTTSSSTQIVVNIPGGYAGTYKLIRVYNGNRKTLKNITNDGKKQKVTYKATNLTSAKPYKFYVICTDGAKCKGVISNIKNKKTALADVTGLQAISSADAVILKWKSVPRATGYIITWKCGSRSGDLKVSGGTTTTYLDNFGTNHSLLHPYAASYTYSIKATKKGYLSSRTAPSVTSDVIRTMLLSITFGTSRTLTSHTGGSVSAYFAKGTTVVATGYTNGKYIFYYNGRQYQVLRASISSASVKQLNTSRTYSAAEATSYVNRMGLSSSTSYLIWVNTYTQKEYIFKGYTGHWTLVQGPWLIASGKPSSPTSTGMTKIVDRMRSNGAPFWNVTYWFSIHGNARVWGALGYPKSGACVRNTNEHAQWIYYNTPMYTAVYVF